MAKQKVAASATVDDVAGCAPEWTQILRQMIFIRRFEEATEKEFRRGKIGGYLHVYIGQEAVASGILVALRKDDVVFAGYRDHAHALVLGSDPGKVMAELFGTATAYALRYEKSERIAVCYFGDGAMNIGSFHEAMNMAGLWGNQGLCPIVFVIENNGYAMGTAVERHSALTDLAARVRAYNTATEKVDGQDIFAVRGVADRVVRQVRETGKPYCIEAVTYRFSGHGAADVMQPYRSKEEVEEHRHRDPILILRNRLAEVCGLGDDDVKEMEEWAAEEVSKALKFAEESPAPEPDELYRDVVSDG